MNKAQIVANELSKITTHKCRAELVAKNNLLLARKNEEFLALDTALRKASLELAKSEDNADLRKKIEKLKSEKTLLLKKLKIDPNSLVPQYACKECKDTGYIGGKACRCLSTLVQNALIAQSGMKNKTTYCFENSDNQVVDNNPHLKKAYAVAKKYVAEFPNFKYKNLVFMGDVGSGKTFLIECMLNELIKRKHYVVFSTAYDINETIQNSFGLGALEKEALLAPYFESELLVIDDLGCEPILRNITVSNLFTVINERQNNNLCTIISTNLNMNEIQDRYGDRVLSRIFNKRNSVVIPFVGKDLRLNN